MLWAAFATLAVYVVGSIAQAVVMLTGVAGDAEQLDASAVGYVLAVLPCMACLRAVREQTRPVGPMSHGGQEAAWAARRGRLDEVEMQSWLREVIEPAATTRQFLRHCLLSPHHDAEQRPA